MTPAGSGKSPTERATGAQSVSERAASLRRQGLSYAEVGRRLGVSRQRAFSVLNKARKTPVQKKQLTPEPDKMLTTHQVAAILGVHGNTVTRWSDAGILKAYRIGRRGDRRFVRADVDNVLAVRGPLAK